MLGLTIAVRKLAQDRFILAMIAALLIGLLVPGPGAHEGMISLKTVAKFGVMAIFFLHGANLAPDVFLNGVKRWRVHIVVHTTTFLVFPALGLVVIMVFGGVLAPELRLGLMFLCALPSTIASAIALTSVGRGNIPVAVFNASLSGLIGLVATPMIMAAFTSANAQIGGDGFALGPAVRDIALTVLAPFVLGQVCRPLVGTFLATHKTWIARVDRGAIVLIIYIAFASSTAAGVWAQFSFGDYAITFAVTGAMLGVVLAGVYGVARGLGLAHDDVVAAVFCGSTKSLANGAPIAQILFAGQAGLGAVMLPLLIYHPLQLVVCAVLAERFARADGA